MTKAYVTDIDHMGRSYVVNPDPVERYPEETAWLIEQEKRFQSDPTMYLCGYAGSAPFRAWTQDPYKAIRFCRRVDAEGGHSLIDDGENGVVIAEHSFGGERAASRLEALKVQKP